MFIIIIIMIFEIIRDKLKFLKFFKEKKLGRRNKNKNIKFF